ncbi:YqgE/AlgH family protein [Persicimonas caeni]|nr:YqgE/AlgH family protein [Persicimonas caeni]
MAESTQNSSSMAPGFLVASPKLDGSPFERAVILLVHHDEEGAMGYIINKPLEVDFGTLIASVNEEIEEAILPERFEQTVYFGGPVRMEQLWVIFKHEGEQARKAPFDSVEPADIDFAPDWTLSPSGRLIEGFALHETDDYIMPVLGYAGWGAGQLEGELEEGSWLVADFDEALIRQTAPADCWKRALAKIGVDPTAFLMMGKMGSA